jgi:hypothetical protein
MNLDDILAAHPRLTDVLTACLFTACLLVSGMEGAA